MLYFGLMGLFPLLLVIGCSASLPTAGTTRPSEYVSDRVATKATITFISHGDMSTWIDDTSKLHWGVALSTDDIVKVVKNNEKEYNHPTVTMDALNSRVIMNTIPTHKQQSVHIDPGVYDWIILIDKDGDGRCELFLGTTPSSVQLDGFSFEAGKTYNIVVDPETRVSIAVTDSL